MKLMNLEILPKKKNIPHYHDDHHQNKGSPKSF